MENFVRNFKIMKLEGSAYVETSDFNSRDFTFDDSLSQLVVLSTISLNLLIDTITKLTRDAITDYVFDDDFVLFAKEERKVNN